MGIFQILIIIGILIFAVVKHLLRTDNKPQQSPVNLPPSPYDYPPIPPLPPIPNEPVKHQPRKLSIPPPPVEKESSAPSGEEGQSPEQEFDIRSVDEVRRAIIWSEILNRKY